MSIPFRVYDKEVINNSPHPHFLQNAQLCEVLHMQYSSHLPDKYFFLQGTLKPYEKKLIEFKFSPKYHSTERGWDHYHMGATQMDYSVLIKFVITNKLGNDDGKYFVV